MKLATRAAIIYIAVDRSKTQDRSMRSIQDIVTRTLGFA